jgi:hypothetical protein
MAKFTNVVTKVNTHYGCKVASYIMVCQQQDLPRGNNLESLDKDYNALNQGYQFLKLKVNCKSSIYCINQGECWSDGP